MSHQVVIPPVADQYHPHWCQNTDDCYAKADRLDPYGDTAYHKRTYSTDNGVELFEVCQVGPRPVPGDTFTITPTWCSLEIRDLPAAAQVLSQIYRDLADVHPKEFRPELSQNQRSDLECFEASDVEGEQWSDGNESDL